MRRKIITTAFTIVITLVSSQSYAEEAKGASEAERPATETAQAQSEESGKKAVEFDGHTYVRYAGRMLSRDEGSDHKLYQRADLEMRENSWGHFKLSLAGDLWQDLDGIALKEDRTYTVQDTWGHRVYGVLYQLKFEVYELSYLDYAALGRQYIAYELPAHLDGGNFSLTFFDGYLNVFAYGGFPVRCFDKEVSYAKDGQVGGGLSTRIKSTNTKIVLEYQYLKEDDKAYEGALEDSARQGAIAVRQQLYEEGFGAISFALLNEQPRHLNANFMFLLSKIEMDIAVSYLYQFLEVEQLPSAISPFAYLLGNIKPYHHIALNIHKGLWENYLSMNLGAEIRMLTSREDEGPFNHSYHHESLAFTLADLPVKGFEFSLFGELWHDINKDAKDLHLTGGGTLGYFRPKEFSASAGLFYSHYRYDYYLDAEEKTGVYTIYADGKYFMLPWLYAGAKYELDIYDALEHRVSLTLGQQF